MERRTFLGLAATGGAGLVMGCRPDAGTSSPTVDTGSPPDPTSSSPAPPPEPDPAAAGLADLGPPLPDRVPRSLARSDDTELDVRLELLSGTLPTDWTGHGFFVHPVPFRDGSPVFLGDGKVVRLDFRPDGVDLRSRVLRPPDHYADLATMGHAAGFSNLGLARSSLQLGFRCFPNTALVALGDRVLVTSDAGRPWEIDPETLELVTPVGWNHEWKDILPFFVGLFVDWPFPMLMSTAHPGVDHETRELFTINYGIPLLGDDTFTDLLRWDGQGSLRSWRVIDHADGSPVVIQQSAHQMAVTRRHVILMDTSFLVEVSLTGPAQAQEQSPDTVLYVIARADLTASARQVRARRVILPRECVHFLADFDDSDGIVLHLAHNAGADPSEWVREGDRLADGGTADRELVGLPCAPTDLGAWGRYVLDPATGAVLSGEFRYDERLWGGPALVAMRGPDAPDQVGATFWCNAGVLPELRLERIESLYADHPYREVALADLPAARPSITRIDAATGEVGDHFEMPPGRVCLSPIFVPREGSTGDDDGYVVVTVISDAGDEIWVFDAANLAQGPLARLGHRQLDLPFTLHTLWVPSVARRRATYQVDIRQDLAPAVRGLSPELRQIFEDEVYPHFS
jgi:carotenoid cleavage dioxygenase-like enzyme